MYKRSHYIRTMVGKVLYNRILVVFFTLLVVSITYAQVIPVQDSAFARYLSEAFPGSCPEEGQLDTIAAQSETGIMYFQNREIGNIDEIVYFKNILGIHATNNNIKTFPKLTGFSNLRYLYISGNGLTIGPDVSELPALEELSVRYNNLVSFPEIGPLSNLKVVELAGNRLKALPDFTVLPALDTVALDYNELSFQALIPLTDYPGFDTIFDVFPQKELTPYDATHHLYVGDRFELSLEDTLGTDILRIDWFYNNDWVNNKIPGAIYPDFIIDNVQHDDTLLYEARITCKNVPEWSGRSIYSGENKLKVYNCPEVDSISYTVQFDCDYGYYIDFSRINFSGTLLGGFAYYLLDTNYNFVMEVRVGIDQYISPGYYRLQYTNHKSCTGIYDSIIHIPDYPVIAGALCPKIDSVSYSLDLSCEKGYSMEFQHLSSLGCSFGDFSYNLLNSENEIVVSNADTGKPYTVLPGEYSLQLTNNEYCNSISDSVVKVLDYPKIEYVDYEATESCSETVMEFVDIEFGVAISGSVYTVINTSTEKEFLLELNKKYSLESGDYIIMVNGGEYCYDTIELYSMPVIDKCSCIEEVDVYLTSSVNCKNGELAYTEISSPENYYYSVLANNITTNGVDTLAEGSPSPLIYGHYSVSIIDTQSCIKDLPGTIEFNKPDSCDIVLYDNVEGTMSSHFIDGEGTFKLINEIGQIMYEQNLPATITTKDLEGNPLSAGYYILLFDDGSSFSVTIVR